MPPSNLAAVSPRFLRGRRATDPQATLDVLRAAPHRVGVHLEEVPAPSRLAPVSLAFTAEVDASAAQALPVTGHAPAVAALEGDDPLATGRFVLLHDPAEPEEWGGAWRVVTFSSSVLEPELAHDPQFAEVGRQWLQECLAQQNCRVEGLSGTTTRVTSEAFGTREHHGVEVALEIRASWTPQDDDLLRHLDAWRDLLVTVAGVPPLPDGVVTLHGVR